MQVIDDTLVCILLEFLEQVLLIDDDLVLGSRLVVGEVVLERVRIRHVLDDKRALLVLLQRDLVEGKSRNGSVGVLLSLSHKYDKVADVLLELGQVLGNILFIELGALIVLHRLSNRKFEVRLAELAAHILHVVFDLAHLAFDIGDLRFFFHVVGLVFFDLLQEIVSCLQFLNIAHPLQLQVMLNLLTNLLVLLIDHVDVGVERVDIVEQRVILLFRFDKCRDDLLDGADNSLLFNLVEGVLNNFDIAGVHVH